MKIGYARVSTRDQNLDLQLEALKNSECEEIFSEKISAVKERPELDKMISILRKGDIVIVWKLDCLGRSLRHLINLVTIFREKGVEFISLNDNIDTTTIHGLLIFNIFASFAEFEWELISERTKAGLEAARKKGRVGERKPGLNKESQNKAYMAHALTLTDKPVQDILKILKLSKSTYYRYLEWVKEHPDKGKKRRVRSASKK